MKKKMLFFAILLCLLNISCNSNQKENESFSMDSIAINDYSSYGGAISFDQIYRTHMIANKYKDMKQGDTIVIAFSGVINDVCKAKGCWMKVGMGDKGETMVKFKDYGFFVPKDIAQDSVIVQGKAYVSETSVKELRHLASDAGASPEEIAAIITPKKTYAFMADGVLIKK